MALAGLAFVALGGATPVHSLEVSIDGLRSTKGLIQLCLTPDPKAFPDCKSGTTIKRSVAATSPHVRIDGLTAGSYAVAVIHDENSNKKLDTFLGIPREGFGFSRNPVIRFGPPSFTATQFPVAGDASVQQVRMKYLL